MITKRLHTRRQNRRIEAALGELKQMIVSQYPTAVFHVTEAPDEPDSIDLLAFVECEDTDEVMDLVIDRLIEMTVEERLPIHVIPLQATADSHPGTIR